MPFLSAPMKIAQKRKAFVCGAMIAFAMLNALADAQTNQEYLKNSIKASLIFETSPKLPTHLQVYLHLVNISGAEETWVADPSMGYLELLDPSGKRASPPPGGWLLANLCGSETLTLPGGSRMDILISTDWGNDDPNGGYVLGADGHIWFIPKDKVGLYTVRVRFPGVFPAPYEKSPPRSAQKPWNLFEIPPQKIVISAAAK